MSVTRWHTNRYSYICVIVCVFMYIYVYIYVYTHICTVHIYKWVIGGPVTRASECVKSPTICHSMLDMYNDIGSKTWNVKWLLTSYDWINLLAYMSESRHKYEWVTSGSFTHECVQSHVIRYSVLDMCNDTSLGHVKWLSTCNVHLQHMQKRRVLKDFRWFIRHHSSVEKSAGLNKCGLSAGPRFDSGRKSVNSNQYGFKQIDHQARVLNYCFRW